MFDASADFSPLTDESAGMSIGQVEQTIVIEIDEDGITSEAKTEVPIKDYETLPTVPRYGSSYEFILDRPFAFILTGEDKSIILSGVVRNID